MNVQEQMNEYWSRRAPAYDAAQHRAERADADHAAWSRVWAGALDVVPARTGGPGPLDVLDVGTGSGHAARVIAALGHRTTGIDLADGMLEQARRHAARMAHPPRFLRGDAVAPDFDDATFDAVTGRYVLWTLREPAAAVERWIALLRPGGVVAMVDSTWFPAGLEHAESPELRRWYDAPVQAALPLAGASTIHESAALLEAAGLVDVRVVALTEVHELDRRFGAAPGHDVQLQHLLLGRRPA